MKRDQTVPADRLEAAARNVAPHLVPIFQAISSGCEVVFCGQEAGPFALPAGRPLIAIVGDDTTKALGPSGFHAESIGDLVRSATHGMIISGAAEPQLYSLAAMAAHMPGGAVVVLIETRLEAEIAWIELLQRAAPGVPLIVSTVGGGTA